MYMIITLFYILIRIIVCVGNVTLNFNVSTTNFTKFHHFWKSTGFCPPDPKENISLYLLSNEQKLNVALIGSLPNCGIKHIRIHWLPNLLIQSKNSESDYNFTYLDSFLLHLHNHSLMPGFEFMGYPNRLINFEKSEEFWKNLAKDIARRYIGKFGVKTVSKWRFETWNEPDLKGYNLLNFTVPEYLAYVNGCSSGLKEAFAGTKSGWKLGGPAGLFRDNGHHPLCWAFLAACDRTAAQGGFRQPPQFLSLHRKGGGSASGVLNASFELLDSIYNRTQKYRNSKRADIEENWSKSLEWRGDVRYAAMVVRVITGYYKSIVEKRKLKIEVLSNDNAFLNYHPFYFTQRTLFARFQMNTTTPPHSQFIRKPVYSVMSLLSLLGDEHLEKEKVTVTTGSDPLLSVIATRRKQGKQSFVSVILAYGNETRSDEGTVGVINVVFGNIPEGDWKFLIYQLDNVRTNPYKVWEGFGGPVFPTRYERRRMREVEEPKPVIHPTTVNGSSLKIHLRLSIPSIYLINICKNPQKFPKTVNNVGIYNITWNEVLITWKYKGRYVNCLRTFEVQNQSKCSGGRHFKRINPGDTIFMSFHHVGKVDRSCEWTRGDYRVRAIDYWDRPGKYSEIISYP